MKLTGIILLKSILDKLEQKHHVYPEETEPIPENMTIREASEFWDSHSVADYPSHVVEMVYAPDDQIAVIAIAAELVDSLKNRAQESGVSIETLVNLWVQEKLTAG